VVVGKSWLIQRLHTAMRSGTLTVSERAHGRELLRGELEKFVFKPGARGRLRLEAARGHDDPVIAAALAVLGSDLAKVGTACLKEPAARTPTLDCRPEQLALLKRGYGQRRRGLERGGVRATNGCAAGPVQKPGDADL
jgi:hypothetical protein